MDGLCIYKHNVSGFWQVCGILARRTEILYCTIFIYEMKNCIITLKHLELVSVCGTYHGFEYMLFVTSGIVFLERYQHATQVPTIAHKQIVL